MTPLTGKPTEQIEFLEELIQKENGDAVTPTSLKNYIVASARDNRAAHDRICETLGEHMSIDNNQIHMTHAEFEEFMYNTGVERDKKTMEAINEAAHLLAEKKLWTAKRVAKYIGGVAVVVLSGLAIAWGSAGIVQNQDTGTATENQKILMQLQATNAELLEHIAVDNDREPTPTPTP